MQYGTFRKQGFFIGSGVIEAGCKTVVGARCKQSGMFWGRPGAQNILALRCIYASNRLDQFWKERLNSRAALNDSLALAAQPKIFVLRPILFNCVNIHRHAECARLISYSRRGIS